MSKFVVNEDMFGKYCTIPTGCSRAEHIYKIVTRIESNVYCDVPLYSGQTEETTHKDVVSVLLVIHCGIDESKVIRVPLAKCKICAVPSGWISVNDNLPDSPRQILVYTDFGGIYVGCYDGDTWFSYGFNTGEEDSYDLVVTHWRELPEPPRMEEKVEE